MENLNVNLLVLMGALIVMLIAMFLFETRKRYCKNCGEKVSSSEGDLCGSCYAEEMLAGRLPDRRRNDE